MFKLDLEKERNIYWIIEKAREFQKNIYFCFIDYAKAFDYVDHNKLWKILKEMGVSDHLPLPLSLETCMWVKKQFRIGHETTVWFKIWNGVQQAVYCYPVYLTCIQSTSSEMWARSITSWN